MRRYLIHDLLHFGWQNDVSWLICFPYSLYKVFYKSQTLRLWSYINFLEHLVTWNLRTHFSYFPVEHWRLLSQRKASLYGSSVQQLWSELLVLVNEHFLFSHKSSHVVSSVSVSLVQTDLLTTHGFVLLKFTFVKLTQIHESHLAVSNAPYL